MTEGRLFEFDGVDARLDLVPLAARRVLDRLGAKVSLDGWRSLCLDDRRCLVKLGSGDAVDEEPARAVLQRASPLPRVTDPSDEPDPLRVPTAVQERLGAKRPLSEKTWSSLEPLERWVLVKLLDGKTPERLLAAYDEFVAPRHGLTHLGSAGDAHMVATTHKPVTERRAVATSVVTMSEEAHRALLRGNAPKGDVLGTARIAGIMAAKQTSQLIPLCHPIHLTSVTVELVPSDTESKVDIRAEVTALDRTGVEMEAMVAASIAALTIYDMLKAVDRSIVVGPTTLAEKSGGRSGEYRK